MEDIKNDIETTADIEWKSKRNKQTDTSTKKSKFLFINLTIDEMRTIKDQYEQTYDDFIIKEVIIAGATTGENRFYIVKALSSDDDQDEFESALRAHVENEKTRYKNKRKVEWFKDKNYEEDAAINDQERDALLSYMEELTENQLTTIFTAAENKAIFAVSVIFPTKVGELLSTGKIPIGDIARVAAVAKVVSGYSDMSVGIDSYDQELKKEEAETAYYDSLNS